MSRKICAVIAPEVFISPASDFLETELGGQSVLSLTLKAVVEAGVDQIICIGSTPSFLAAAKEVEVDSPMSMVHLDSHQIQSHLEAISSYLESPKEETDIVILAGNQPLLEAGDISAVIDSHAQSQAAVSISSGGAATLNSGTVLVTDKKQRVTEVVASRTAFRFSSEEDSLTEAYGLYVFAADLLGPAVRRAKPLSGYVHVLSLIHI